MDTEVSTRRQTHGENRAAEILSTECTFSAAKIFLSGLLNELELFKGLLHFDDSACAVYQLKAWLLLLDEGKDQTEQADSLSCACWHF